MPFTNPGLFTATSVHLTLATKHFLSNHPYHFLQHGEKLTLRHWTTYIYVAQWAL